MFDNVVVGIDGYEAGRDALELAKQLVAPDGDMLLVFVEVVMRAPGPDTDPQWHSEARRVRADLRRRRHAAGPAGRALRRRRGAHRLRDAPAFARHDRRRVRRLARERAGADRGEHARPRAGRRALGVRGGRRTDVRQRSRHAVSSPMWRRVTPPRPWHGMRRQSISSSSVPTSTGCATGSRVAARPSDWRTALRARCSC